MKEQFDKKTLTISELAYFLGTRQSVLKRLVVMEIIEPVSTKPEYCFSVHMLPKCKKILRLHHQLGVSWGSMNLVLDLLDKIEELEDKIGAELE